MDHLAMKLGKHVHPRDGDPPRGATPQASDIILAMMLVFLAVGGLAYAFTELFHR
jgi:hypothetical protein